ncbi:hypothetical protein KTO58_24410 [Chitinophaga pendula]|uniref:hypothetical protein n=1 Tax=Chitinophaga TaxID=79328 RepID=UPI0012FE6F7F|nr:MULTISPECIES: hypothetical protein [Chitinophaga]UCJ06775.1 hypothetical protein KTO58_24410 [Chitinophaga pendula]
MRVAGDHIIIYRDHTDITGSIFLLFIALIPAAACLILPIAFYREVFTDLSDIIPGILFFIAGALCLMGTEWVLRAAETSKIYKDKNQLAWLPFGSFLLCMFLSVNKLKANAVRMETTEAWVSIGSLSLGLILLLYIVRKALRISYDKKKLPILTLHPEGLAYLDNPLYNWENIDHIDLWTVFDQKMMQLHLHSKEVIEYPLINQYEVSEFKNLHLLQTCLKKFIEKVEIREDRHQTG